MGSVRAILIMMAPRQLLPRGDHYFKDNFLFTSPNDAEPEEPKLQVETNQYLMCSQTCCMLDRHHGMPPLPETIGSPCLQPQKRATTSTTHDNNPLSKTKTKANTHRVHFEVPYHKASSHQNPTRHPLLTQLTVFIVCPWT